MGIPLRDMDKVEAWKGGAMLGVGWHNVTIESAEEGTSSNNNPQVEIEFFDPESGASIRDWIVFTEKSLGKARSLLDAVSIVPESGEWEFPTEKLPGRKLSIYVGEEPDNRPGETGTRLRVQAYAEPGKAKAQPNGGPASDDDLPF